MREDIASERFRIRENAVRLSSTTIQQGKTCDAVAARLSNARDAVAEAWERQDEGVEIQGPMPMIALDTSQQPTQLGGSQVPRSKMQSRLEDLDQALEAITELHRWLPESFEEYVDRVETNV